MDLYHTGEEEPNDDHRFVNERLLEVAILSEPVEGSDVITLEDCLENYFNNRIEVKRHMERHRSNTLQSPKSPGEDPPPPPADEEKLSAMHIETVEFAEGEILDSPMAETSDSPAKSTMDRLRPAIGRKRADSIFSQRRTANSDSKKSADDPDEKNPERQRKGSLRTEVLMPAWQFFKLLPWYTDNVPTSDAQVAAHFSHKRPVLGIALKRYQVSHQGVASRLDTYVDIPLEIAVPAFVSDDNIGDDSPLVGNFKLVLQSVVCHRGTSVNSGHYVSLVRGQAANARDRGSFESRPNSPYSDDDADPWMLFDDLAKDRVTYVDVEQKLREECPYLLFYQVQPIDELPPTYEESCSRIPSQISTSPEKIRLLGSFAEGDEGEFISDTVIVEDDSRSPTSPNGFPATNTEAFDWSTSARTSLDINTTLDERGRRPPYDIRGRSSMSSNRSSGGIIDDVSVPSGSVKGCTSVPSTPVDETRSSFLGLPMSRRGSRVSGKSKSRPSSQGAEERSSRFGINLSMSKLSSIGRSPSRIDLSSLAKTAEEADSGNTATNPTAEKTNEVAALPTVTTTGSTPSKHEKHNSNTSVAGSVASLTDIPIAIGGSTESLGSKPDTIAVAEVSDDHRKKNWKEKMEMKREERSRMREEKSKEKSESKDGGKEKHHGKKKKEKGKGDMPDRECAVM